MMSDRITTLVFVMASLILLQSLIMVAVSIGIHRKASRLRRRADSATRKLTQALRGFREVLDRVGPVFEKLPKWARVLETTFAKVLEATNRFDETADGPLETVRSKLGSFSDQSDRALVAISQISGRVQRAVSEPGRRLSGAISSLSSRIPGWGTGKNPRAPHQHHAEDELFI